MPFKPPPHPPRNGWCVKKKRPVCADTLCIVHIAQKRQSGRMLWYSSMEYYVILCIFHTRRVSRPSNWKERKQQRTLSHRLVICFPAWLLTAGSLLHEHFSSRPMPLRSSYPSEVQTFDPSPTLRSTVTQSKTSGLIFCPKRIQT